LGNYNTFPHQKTKKIPHQRRNNFLTTLRPLLCAFPDVVTNIEQIIFFSPNSKHCSASSRFLLTKLQALLCELEVVASGVFHSYVQPRLIRARKQAGCTPVRCQRLIRFVLQGEGVAVPQRKFRGNFVAGRKNGRTSKKISRIFFLQKNLPKFSSFDNYRNIPSVT
jgi:hypothetical protein